ncbi:MAG: hypothetical protein ACRECH_12840 [Nitrososphaerales archaeon]
MTEIKETKSLKEANAFLSQGFELLEVRSVYILGKATRDKASPQNITQTKALNPSIPLSIHWVQKSDSFAWSFATERDGSPIEEIHSFVETLKKGSIEENGFRYSLSKDGKFLQRTRLERKK